MQAGAPKPSAGIKMKPKHQIGLILGQQLSSEVQCIHKEIIRQGHIPIVIDTKQLGTLSHIEYHVNDASLCLISNDQKVFVSQISSVYWASVHTPVLDEFKLSGPYNDAHILKTVVTQPKMDVACLMQLLFAQTQIKWLNSFEAIQMHRLKPQQLSIAKSLGASIPLTYVGNCPKSIDSFLSVHPDVIIKPVFAGGHTKRLPLTLTPFEKITKWAKYPVTVQAYIEGDDIRTYIIGNFMISAKVEALHDTNNPVQSCDYREALNVKLVVHALPTKIQQLAMRIMHAYHLQYTAIDWRLSPSGEYFFLEANPAPLFTEAQQQLGVEFDRAIVDLMFE
jgi:glutathione synthase/RimK-type ligase-like ATP-grasp enzyme